MCPQEGQHPPALAPNGAWAKQASCSVCNRGRLRARRPWTPRQHCHIQAHGCTEVEIGIPAKGFCQQWQAGLPHVRTWLAFRKWWVRLGQAPFWELALLIGMSQSLACHDKYTSCLPLRIIRKPAKPLAANALSGEGGSFPLIGYI